MIQTIYVQLWILKALGNFLFACKLVTGILPK